MKKTRKIFLHIQSLPEEWRRFLAVGATILAAVILFFSWSAITSLNLIPIQNNSPENVLSPKAEENSSIGENNIISPKESIAEIFQSIERLFK